MYPEQPQPNPNYPHPQPNPHPQPKPNYPQSKDADILKGFTGFQQQKPKQPLPLFKILEVVFAVSLLSLIGYVALPSITGAMALTGDSNSTISKDQMILDLSWDMNLLLEENDRVKSEKSDCINKKAQTQDNLTICTSEKQTYADDKDSLLLQLASFTNGSSECDSNFSKCRDDLFDMTKIITDKENDYNALSTDYNLLREQHDSNTFDVTECQSNLDSNITALSNCQTEMIFCQADLEICLDGYNCETESVDLNICQADLLASQEDFNISQADLNYCNTNLDSNISILNICQADLIETYLDLSECHLDLIDANQTILDLNLTISNTQDWLCSYDGNFCCDFNSGLSWC